MWQNIKRLTVHWRWCSYCLQTAGPEMRCCLIMIVNHCTHPETYTKTVTVKTLRHTQHLHRQTNTSNRQTSQFKVENLQVWCENLQVWWRSKRRRRRKLNTYKRNNYQNSRNTPQSFDTTDHSALHSISTSSCRQKHYTNKFMCDTGGTHLSTLIWPEEHRMRHRKCLRSLTLSECDALQLSSRIIVLGHVLFTMYGNDLGDKACFVIFG